MNPGGRVEDIRFAYEGVGGSGVAADGSLRVGTAHGDLVHRRPVAYQTIGGRRVGVDVRFRPLGGHGYGFRVRAYDRRYPLVVDPVVLVSSTYLGGSSTDQPGDVALDAAGNIYILAQTWSANFPMKKALDPKKNGPGSDLVVTKMDPAAKKLLFSTYVGGPESETGGSIAIDAAGSAYVCGGTKSPTFPIKNAFDPTHNGGYDGFFLKLTPQGTLVFSTFLGARGAEDDDVIEDIRVDGQGFIYLLGETDGPSFPVQAGFDMTHNGKTDLFVAKFDPAARSLVYSTFLGGSAGDYPLAMAIDASGAAYVTGETDSKNYPRKNAFQTVLKGEADAFVTKLNPSGKTLAFSTLIGGSGFDSAYVIRTDAAGNAYVAGQTDSANFPVLKGFDQTYNGGDDGFLLKLAPTGKTLVFSTFLGGKDDEGIVDIVPDDQGYLYASCWTGSSNLPLRNPLDAVFGGIREGYLAKFSPTGKSLVFSTYLGGSDIDGLGPLALDKRGNLVGVGFTRSRDFPVKSAFDTTANGDIDIFIVRISFPAGTGSRTEARAKR